MRFTGLFTFILLSMIMACAPQKSARTGSGQTTFTGPVRGGSAAAPKVAVTYGGPDWTPVNVEVTCASAKCPLQIGVLFFAEKMTNGEYALKRCTAFLISADSVMSNGHCDDSKPGNKAYFVTQKINGRKEVREVAGVTFKRFTPDPNGADLSAGRPDIAIFKLAEPVRGISPLYLATGPQLNFNKLTAFAVFPGENDENFRVESRDCKVRRHEIEFPFEMAEAPDVIRAFDCTMVAGNSGAPMFAAGSSDVQAVHMGAVDPIERAKDFRAKHNRELENYQKHWASQSTNVRCLDLPGAKPLTCVKVTQEASRRKFEDIQRVELEKLRSRLPELKNSGLQFYANPFQLNPANDLRFEVVFMPACRTEAKLSAVAVVPIEQMKFEFDEWASPRLRILSTANVPATVESAGGTVVHLSLSWPERAGTYLHPQNDLRTKWGSRFPIDLPVCPR